MSIYPAGWALQKPQQTIEPAEFVRLWRQGRMEATLKRDGNRVHIVTAGDDTRVYSRNGTLDWTDKLRHIADRYRSAPAGLLIDGEAHTRAEGTRDFQDAMNSDSSRVVISTFDMLCLDGSNVTARWGDRRDALMQVEQSIGFGGVWGGGVAFDLPRDATYDTALALIEAAKCEGLVVWDVDAGHAINTNGNTKRGKSWKIKLRRTEDLLITAQIASNDPTLGVGTVKASRRCEETGRLVPIKAALGSFDLGFDRHGALLTQLPYVAEVTHYGEDENGNLVFPKVLRKRPDLHADFGLLPLAA